MPQSTADPVSTPDWQRGEALVEPVAGPLFEQRAGEWLAVAVGTFGRCERHDLLRPGQRLFSRWDWPGQNCSPSGLAMSIGPGDLAGDTVQGVAAGFGKDVKGRGSVGFGAPGPVLRSAAEAWASPRFISSSNVSRSPACRARKRRTRQDRQWRPTYSRRPRAGDPVVRLADAVDRDLPSVLSGPATEPSASSGANS
jgi:hypothetical protein